MPAVLKTPIQSQKLSKKCPQKSPSPTSGWEGGIGNEFFWNPRPHRPGGNQRGDCPPPACAYFLPNMLAYCICITFKRPLFTKLTHLCTQVLKLDPPTYAHFGFQNPPSLDHHGIQDFIGVPPGLRVQNTV